MSTIPDTDERRHWLSIPEAAARTGFTRYGLYAAIRRGDLLAVKPRGSRVWRIDAYDLDDFMRHGGESLAHKVRVLLAEHRPGDDDLPEPTDEQIRELARLLPRRRSAEQPDGGGADAA